MAGVKISALPAVVASQLSDIFAVVQSSTTSKCTISQLVTLLNTNLSGYVPITGGTMSGPLILSGDPTLPLGAATKQYVDLFASGITVILATQAATTGNLNATQAGAGVGATLTNAGAMAAFAVDGYSASLNDRILVKDQTLSQHNGVYSVTTLGSGAVNWVLTRTTDYDLNTQIVPGTLIAVNNGTVNAMTSWLETATVNTVDTDPVLFSQFTFAPTSFLQKANNLSDLASVPTALVNLGLGSPTGTGNVVLQTSPTLITPILGVATATSLQFSPTTNGIIGTTTNDNAQAGRVGEYIISNIPASGAGVNIINTTAMNITSISLTAGDWDITGNVYITTTGGFDQFFCWSNNASATIPDLSQVVVNYPSSSFPQPQGGLAIFPKRYSVAGPTTVYLQCFVGLISGTGKAYGNISARRVR
jgi:hypothetical protein